MNNKGSNRKSNDGINFFVGIILLGLGLFLLMNRISVGTSWFGNNLFSIGGYGVPSGLSVLPLIAGIIMFFYNTESKIARLLMVFGVVLIVASIIFSVQIRLMPTSLYMYILIIGMIAAGTGMTLKGLFKKK